MYTNPSRWSNSLQQIISTIQFDHLKSFSTRSVESASLDFLIDNLIVKNTALESIAIDTEILLEQFSKMIAPLPQLKEVTVTWRYMASRVKLKQSLEHVISSNHPLAKITVKLSEYNIMT